MLPWLPLLWATSGGERQPYVRSSCCPVGRNSRRSCSAARCRNQIRDRALNAPMGAVSLERDSGGKMFARWSAATVLATALAVAPAHADPVANFYKRRQVDLIVGSG